MTKPGAEGRLAGKEPWLSTLLRIAVYATTAVVFAFPLATLVGTAAAGCGAAIGAFAGRWLHQSKLRIVAGLGLCCAVFLLGWALAHLTVDFRFVSSTFGPERALALGDVVAFGLGGASLGAALRMLSSRVRVLTLLEVGAIALAFAQLVVAHRHGAINRPFEIADPILSRGSDPTITFLALGVLAAVVIAAVLLSERSIVRAGLTFCAALLLLVGIAVGVRVVGTPPPPLTGGGLGLRDEPQEEDGQGDGRRGRRDNEQLDFQDNYNSSSNQVPVAVVLLHDDYSPPTGVYYFRQGAFSQFNGRRLVGASRGDVDRDIAQGFFSEPTDIPERPPEGPDRVELETTVALLADHTRPFGLEAPERFEPRPNPDTGRFRRLYRVTSSALETPMDALIGRPAGAPSWTAEQHAHYTAGPPDPRYAALATQIVEEELPPDLRTDPMAQAFAITSWLGRHGSYSLRSHHANAPDPTADFLFGDKVGYCVHFAHAATYLMRARGLPTRVATGYAVDESFRQGGSTILLSGQTSHAWPEIYVDGVGWIITDVVPETVLDPPPPPPDPELQRLLGELARGEALLPLDGQSREPIEVVATRAASWFGLFGLFSLSSLVALLWVVKVWRQLVPSFARAEHLPRLLYRAELDRLSDVGVSRRLGETREAFAARIAPLVPSFSALTAAHLSASFGRSATAAVALARQASKRLWNERDRKFSWWRRWLGMAAPWTWLQSR